MTPDVRDELIRVLTEARQRGFLGPGPVADHIDLALGMAQAIPEVPTTALDLGSGGGVPGLVLSALWSSCSWVLLDSQLRRTDFLTQAVRALQMEGRVRVVRARAETAGRTVELRATFDLVVARSFGTPAITAECGAPFLRVGAALVVAEPPGPPLGRWSASGIAQVGLRQERHREAPTAWILLHQMERCPDRYPRRAGIPSKRPLFAPTADA